MTGFGDRPAEAGDGPGPTYPSRFRQSGMRARHLRAHAVVVGWLTAALPAVAAQGGAAGVPPARRAHAPARRRHHRRTGLARALRRRAAQALDPAPSQGGFVGTTFTEAGHYPFIDFIGFVGFIDPDMAHAEPGAHGTVEVTK